MDTPGQNELDSLKKILKSADFTVKENSIAQNAEADASPTIVFVPPAEDNRPDAFVSRPELQAAKELIAELPDEFLSKKDIAHILFPLVQESVFTSPAARKLSSLAQRYKTKKRTAAEKGQSIIEYSMIIVLVIFGIIVMGPYIIRSVQAHLKMWEDSVHESMDEEIDEPDPGSIPPPPP